MSVDSVSSTWQFLTLNCFPPPPTHWLHCWEPSGSHSPGYSILIGKLKGATTVDLEGLSLISIPLLTCPLHEDTPDL